MIKQNRAIGLGEQGISVAKPIRIAKEHSFRNHSPDYQPKHEQRSLIARHILDVCGYGRLKLISMPGTSWEFENMLYSVNGRMFINAFELDSRACEFSSYSAPGYGRTSRCSWRSIAGHYSAYQSRGVRTTLFNADVCDFLEGHLFPISWKSETRWKRMSTEHNAVWLDPYSPLGSQFYERVFRSIGASLSKSSALCFSFLVGRDGGHINQLIKIAPGVNAMEKRAAVVKEKLRQFGVLFSVSGVHQYSSENKDGTVTLGTVFGVARNLKR